MDLLDLLMPKEDYVLSGTYRDFKDVPGAYFEYKEVDGTNNTFGEITDNIITTKRSLVIRTRQDLDYKVNGFVTTQDGQMWTIMQIRRNSRNAENLRFMVVNPNSEFTITLIGVDDARGLQ